MACIQSTLPGVQLPLPPGLEPGARIRFGPVLCRVGYVSDDRRRAVLRPLDRTGRPCRAGLPARTWLVGEMGELLGRPVRVAIVKARVIWLDLCPGDE